MTDRDRLHAAILDDPTDDNRRLIFADWLEEFGGEGERLRAEFIRVQVRLPHLIIGPCEKCLDAKVKVPCPCDAVWREHRHCGKRQVQLLYDNYLRWAFGPFLPHGCEPAKSRVYLTDGNHNPCQMVFRRGFVAEVRLGHGLWLAHGPAIVRQHPVERVDFTDWQAVHVDREPGFDSWTVSHCYSPDSPINPIRGYVSTEEEAITDLSIAALVWAKRQPCIPAESPSS